MTFAPPIDQSIAATERLINTGADDLRYLGISTVGEVDVVDYPDSKKIAVAAGVKNADFKTATYAGLGHIAPADYYDGEGCGKWFPGTTATFGFDSALFFAIEKENAC